MTTDTDTETTTAEPALCFHGLTHCGVVVGGAPCKMTPRRRGAVARRLSGETRVWVNR